MVSITYSVKKSTLFLNFCNKYVIFHSLDTKKACPEDIWVSQKHYRVISYDTKKRPQIIGTNEMPDFCQMLCFSRKTRKHMQHQTNKRCSRLCGICTKTVTAVPLLSVNRGMNGSVFIWNYIKLKLNIADMEYILHFFNKYVNHFYRLRSI